MRKVFSFWRPTFNLIAWYRMDERSGTIIHDYSFNRNPGTLEGSTIPTWNPTNGLNFSAAIPNYVNIINSPVFPSNVAVTPLTISCWIRPTTVSPANQSIVSNFGGTGGNQFELSLTNSTNVSITIAFDGGNAGIPSAANLSANSLYFLVVTYDGNNMHLYINGIEDTNSPLNIGPAYIEAYIGNLGIGIWGDLISYPYSGMITDIRMYDIALNKNQINSMYSAGSF